MRNINDDNTCRSHRHMLIFLKIFITVDPLYCGSYIKQLISMIMSSLLVTFLIKYTSYIFHWNYLLSPFLAFPLILFGRWHFFLLLLQWTKNDKLILRQMTLCHDSLVFTMSISSFIIYHFLLGHDLWNIAISYQEHVYMFNP